MPIEFNIFDRNVKVEFANFNFKLIFAYSNQKFLISRKDELNGIFEIFITLF